VNVEDELEIREVFFGEGATGNSYAVLCHAEESKIPISSVFQDASNDGSAPAHFRVIDCNHVLPSSGKSIADRFGIDLKQRPSIFLSGKVGEPRQIPTKFLKTGAMLVRYLKGKLEPHAAKIETTQDLRAKCLDKEICALLLKGSNKKPPSYLKDAMQKLLVEFPTVAFASIDASALYVYNLEEYLPELRNEQPRFVVFKKVSGTIEKGGDRLITSYATLPSGSGVSYGPMSNLVAGVIRNTTPTEKIPVLPTIKTRTKKLEREEAAKRERKANRGPATTPPGMFSENDGSREGRRAERDRRRTEHRKNQNVREKTPEEIAEMERQRRQRMAEEAARWNMAPDDAPPTGEPMPADSYMFDDEEEERTTIVEEVDETLTDDEDVMDLD
jgi:hypothetical protein